MSKKISLLAVFLILVASSHTVIAQNYNLKSKSINSGGSVITSASFKTDNTVAGTLDEIIVSTSYKLISGFQATAMAFNILLSSETQIL